MEYKEAIQLLKDHNEWRRGGGVVHTNAEKLGIAIDVVVKQEQSLPLVEATDKEKLLAKHLDVYIKDRHTQEECIGFIDGFKEALTVRPRFNVVKNKRYELKTNTRLSKNE
jgi:hypothetical protein